MLWGDLIEHIMWASTIGLAAAFLLTWLHGGNNH